MKFYTREQLLELVGIDGIFLVALEGEEIVVDDAPERGAYSERMVERARVAHELVHELDVNVEGAAIIVRMREEIAGLRHDLEQVLAELRRRGER